MLKTVADTPFTFREERFDTLLNSRAGGRLFQIGFCRRAGCGKWNGSQPLSRLFPLGGLPFGFGPSGVAGLLALKTILQGAGCVDGAPALPPRQAGASSALRLCCLALRFWVQFLVCSR